MCGSAAPYRCGGFVGDGLQKPSVVIHGDMLVKEAHSELLGSGGVSGSICALEMGDYYS